MSETSAALHAPWHDIARQREAVSFGIWVFLASEALFFGGLFLTYFVYRIEYGEAFKIAAKETDVFYGTLNTVILLTSSLTMAMVGRAAEAGFRRMALGCLAATAALGSAFLVVKGFEYYDDISKGLLPGPGFPLQPAQTQIFWTFYWVATIIHAIHLTIGIGAVGIAGALLSRGRLSLRTAALEAIALYWHFVDVIWIILLPMIYLIGRAS